MKIFKFRYLLSILVMTLLAACSTDDADRNGNNDAAGTETSVTFDIKTTRGVLTPAVNDNELISSYTIVVVQNGNIVKVINGTALKAAEMHSVKASLRTGSYKVYAFANINFDGSEFVVGQEMPDLSAKYYVNDAFKNGFTGPIPMSNSENGLDINILPSKGTNTYGIEVVRMVAKLEFVFMNSSEKNIEVSEICVGPLTDSSIRLSMYDDLSSLSFSGTSTTAFTHTIASPITLNAGSTGNGISNVVCFNVLESNPDPVTKQFNLRFKVKYNGVEEYRYALLDKSLVAEANNLDGDPDKSPFIRRNDWIRIPIDLGDYKFHLEALWYPPIGGYPSLEIDDKSEGEYVVNLLTPGEMVLFPSINRYDTPLDKIYLTDLRIKNVDISISGDNIWETDKAPQLNAAKELTATVKSNGTSCITLTITFTPDPEVPSVTKSITRKIYIKL